MPTGTGFQFWMSFKERRTYGRFLAQFYFLTNVRSRTDCTRLHLQGVNTMSETSETLAFITSGWQNYQKHLSRALARLTPEQLALRAAPNLRSIEELARHIIAVRAAWFHFQMGEGDDAFGAIASWM